MATNKFEKTPVGITTYLVGHDKDGFMAKEETLSFVRTDKVVRGDGIAVALDPITGKITVSIREDLLVTIENSKIVSDLKALAFKEKAALQDIEAAGDRNSSTFLSGDGTFKVPSGGGDMLKSIYDPNNVNADAFSLGNMTETTDVKKFTSTNQTKLSSIADSATKNQTDTWLTNRENHHGNMPLGNVTGLSDALVQKFSDTNQPAMTQVVGLSTALNTVADELARIDGEAVKTTAQTLTDIQKIQARQNIDAFPSPAGTVGQFVRGDGTLGTSNKASVGLSNVDNTSDANKPISSATLTALNLKFDKAGGFLTAGSQIIADYAPRPAWSAKGTFYARGYPGSFAGMYTNPAPFVTNTIQETNVFTAGLKMEYAQFNGTNYFTGAYAVGTLKVAGDGQNPGQMCIVHIDSAGQNQRIWSFDGGNGNFAAPGAISGTAKNFVIDHPADPNNFDLIHASTEAPELLVEYRGHVKLKNGKATVDVEKWYGVKTDTFKKLWADPMVHGLQNQTSFDRVRPSAVTGATFEIISENSNSNDVIAWHLIARRNDPLVRWSGFTTTDADGKLIIEKEKED